MPIYYHGGDTFAVFTNRSYALTGLGSPRRWDTRALAWLIGHSNLFGERMPVDGASYLPPERQARVGWTDAQIQLERSPQWIWPGPSEVPDREQLPARDWDAITESLVENFRDIGRLHADIRLMLSGGKDSRLCLALSKAAGLRDRLTCITNGAPGGPEVSCAAAVAEAAAFEHRLGPLPETPVEQREWKRLRQHLYRYEAIVCPRDGETEARAGTTVSIRGMGGELYRGPGGHAPQFKRTPATTLDAMAKKFVDYHQHHDPLGILHAEENAFQADWLQTWVYTTADHVRFDLLPEKFYVDYRLGLWNGPLGQGTPAEIKVDPLLSATVAVKNWSLAPVARGTDRLHYEVMRRTAPELLAVPILNDVWAKQVVADSDIALPAEPFRTNVVVDARTLRSGRWRFLEAEGDTIIELLNDADRDTEMGTICDIQKLKNVVRDPTDLSNIQVKEIESCIAVALALLDRAEPVLDRP